MEQPPPRLRDAVVDCGVSVWSYDFVKNEMSRTANHDALYGIAPQATWVLETFLNATHPEDRHLANQHIGRCAVPGGADDYAFDFRVVWPDQSVHWLAVAGHVDARDAGGAATVIHGVIRDVTREKNLELELRAAVRERDELLQLVTHELNTPLHALAMKAVLLREKRHGTTDADLEFIERHVQKLAVQVKDLLEAGRLGAATLRLSRTDVSLGDIARAVVDDFALLGARAGCDVELVVENDVVGAYDRARLEQVVANLLMNAFKYGGGKPVRVAVDGARLSVADHGIGIEPAQQTRIFDKFVRAPAAGAYGGLGLGLYVARGIVVAHGGRIDVDSAAGAGARFTVVFDAA